MEGRIDANAAGEARSKVADAALAALLARVLADFAARFGRIRGGAMAVVLLGKAGSREMMAGSDLDMLFVYDHPARVTQSTGPRRLPASQWFIRAVHAYVAALTAPDAGGPMFDVDMRLRPSGNKGPVAVSLASFTRYHAAAADPGDKEPGGSAWTWERMALTRARVVAGPAKLRAGVEQVIRAAIANAGGPDRIRADAAFMRTRLLRDLPPEGPWDVKLWPGGQIDVEFIAQALHLVHAAAMSEMAHPATRHTLAALRDAGLLGQADADLLIRADLVWRTVQGVLRITYGRSPPEQLSDSAATALLGAVAAAEGTPAVEGPGGVPVDLAALRATMDALARDVRAAFVRHVGEIGS
jgi:glutamate-ammonia-ligase adenylyltransferase